MKRDTCTLNTLVQPRRLQQAHQNSEPAAPTQRQNAHPCWARRLVSDAQAGVTTSHCGGRQIRAIELCFIFPNLRSPGSNFVVTPCHGAILLPDGRRTPKKLAAGMQIGPVGGRTASPRCLCALAPIRFALRPRPQQKAGRPQQT